MEFNRKKKLPYNDSETCGSVSDVFCYRAGACHLPFYGTYVTSHVKTILRHICDVTCQNHFTAHM